MQHGPAIAETFAEDAALEVAAAIAAPAPLRRRRLGGRQHQGMHDLRQHHRDGLQDVDLFLTIGPLGPVLDNEDTSYPAGAQDRHAQESMERVFARFRAVGEGRMARRILDGDRLRGACDIADKAFAGGHACLVHGFGLQAFGGDQQQRAFRLAQVDRAYIGHHRRGYQAHDMVQPRARVPVLRHHLAEIIHQYTRGRQVIGHTLPLR